MSQGVLDGAISAYAGRALTALTGPDVVTRKNRLGLDGQAYWELPRVGGGTLRAELYVGHELNPDSVKVLTVTGPTGRALRVGADPARFATDVQGGYVMWVQSLGEAFQAAARYDWFDPNVDRDRDQYRRLGLGLHAFWGGLTRVTLAYDVPMTDAAAPGGGYRDPHDNLWTVQFQHRF
jgi:hypothetical protein